MNITEKILAKAAGLKTVEPGQLIKVKLDLVMANDITAPLAIQEFHKSSVKKAFNKNKVILVMDHFSPAKDIASAGQIKYCRDFAKEQKLTYFFDVGKMGIEHALLPEQGFIKPGDCIIGADSHTCTYGALSAFSTGVGSTDLAYAMATGITWFKVPSSIKVILIGKPKKWVSGKDIILYLIGKIGVDGALYEVLEFTGPGVKYLTIDDRFTICNMAIEAGAKSGIFSVDEITYDYLKDIKRSFSSEVARSDSSDGGTKRCWKDWQSDPDAKYSQTIKINLNELEPQVAFPHLPSNTKSINQIKQKIKIDQVVIGSCTNGRISDLRIAASILKNKNVAKGIRCIVIPATQAIYLKAMKENLIDIFIKAGCAVSTPTCGPCLGGYMGILAEGESVLATTNRNFVGRMGHPKSKVYLASPAIAAASAIAGYIKKP